MAKRSKKAKLVAKRSKKAKLIYRLVGFPPRLTADMLAEADRREVPVTEFIRRAVADEIDRIGRSRK